MGIYVGAEERKPHMSSDKGGRIYRRAVPVLKKKKLKMWSFHAIVVKGRQRNVQKNRDGCCFAN